MAIALFVYHRLYPPNAVKSNKSKYPFSLRLNPNKNIKEEEMASIAQISQLCLQPLVQSFCNIHRKEPNLYVHGTPTYINTEEK